jgi:hypothetical protein
MLDRLQGSFWPNFSEFGFGTSFLSLVCRSTGVQFITPTSLVVIFPPCLYHWNGIGYLLPWIFQWVTDLRDQASLVAFFLVAFFLLPPPI